MIRKIVTMCAAALFACAGAVAEDDGGVDPGINVPGRWSTSLFVDGARVTSEHLGGTGWSFKHESYNYRCGDWTSFESEEYKYSTLTISKAGSYTLKGSSEAKRPLRILINADCTVTLEQLNVTAPWMYSAITIKDGCKVKFYLKGTSVVEKDCEHFYNDDENEYGCHEYCRVQGTWDLAALTLPQKSVLTVDGDSDGDLQIDGYVGVGQVQIVKPLHSRTFDIDTWTFARHAKFGIGGALVVNGGSMSVQSAAWLYACSVYGGSLAVRGSVRSRTCVSDRDMDPVGGETSFIDMDLYHNDIHRLIMAFTLTGKTVGEDGWEEALDKKLLKEDYIQGLRVVNGVLVAARGRLEGFVCGAEEVYVTGAFDVWLNDDSRLYASVSRLTDVTFGDGARGVITVGEISGHMEIWNGADVKIRHLNVDSLTVYGGRVGITLYVACNSLRVTGGEIFGLDSNDEKDVNSGTVRTTYLQMGAGRIEVQEVKSENPSIAIENPSLAIEMRGGLIRGNLLYSKATFFDGTTIGEHEVGDRLTIFGGSHTGAFSRAPEGGPVRVTVGDFEPWSKLKISGLPDSYGVKSIYADGVGGAYLWLPSREEPYRFTVNGNTYEATVHGTSTTATLVEAKRYSVSYQSAGGRLYDGFNNCWSEVMTWENMYGYGETPTVYGPENLQLSCEGKRFDHWEIVTDGRKTVMPGEKLPPITGDVTLVAYWVEITADDVSKEPEEGAASVDPAKAGEKIVTVRFYLDPWEGNPREYVEQDYIAGSRYGNLPVVTPPAGRVLDFWQRRTGGGFGGEKITEDSIVRAENHCLYANWKLPPTTEWTCQFVTKTGLSDDSDWSVFATHDFNIASPVAWMPSETPTRPRHRFVRWETYNDRECIMEPVTIDTIVAQRPSWVEAVWERDWFDWTRNRFESKVLSTITDDFPSDPAQVKSVKGQGLAAGLKLVQEKATKQWCLEGVPTELIDHATRDMYVEVTLKDGTKSTLLVKVRVNPEVPVVMRPAFVNENYGMCEYMHRLDENGRQLGSVAEVTPAEMRHPFVMADEYWPGAAKDWKITGLPAGLKFATKDATAWTDAVGIKQFAPLGSIYGFVKAPCAAIVTASHTVKGVAGGSYTESFKSTIEIHTYETTSDGYWIGGFLTDARIDGYVGEKTVYTFSSEHGLANNSKFKFTGLPSGLSYTAVEKKVSGYEKPIPAGSIYGTLKKETKAWASGTDGSGDRPLTVIVSFTERPPEVSVNAGAGGLLKAALMKFKPTEAAAIAEAGTALMQGAAYKYRISCDADAKVKVAGQPTGLKVVQNKDKKSADYGKWTLEGVPTKPGEYIAVITVTLNGVSSSITQRYVVRENAFAGEYRGVIASSPAADAAPRAGTILVNIAAGGATKVTVSEDGKSTLTYSAKSFGYSDSGDYAFVEFELKPSSADKKAGYGVRKGRVTISKPDAEVTDYRIFEGTVKLEDGTAVGEVEGWFVAPSAADDYRTSISRECRFFSVNDGSFDAPIATVRLQIKAGAKGKAATADVAGTLYDGTAFKLAKVPLIRDVVKPAAGEEANACYSFAPFAAKAKDGQVFVFHGFKRPVSWNELGAEGRVTFVNAAGEVVTVEEESGEGRSAAAIDFNSFFSHRYASSQMIFDYGRDGFESFELDHASGAAKGDCVVLDAGGSEVTKIPAKSKIGLLGDFTYKFTTKDKVYTYEINLVTAPLERYLADGTIDWMESGRLVGLVTKTWKDGKATKSLSGIVDVVGLEPAE